MTNLYIAYFYDPHSTVVDGWYNRLTCPCNETGGLERQVDYDFVVENQYRYIGHYKLGGEPKNVWRAAKSV